MPKKALSCACVLQLHGLAETRGKNEREATSTRLSAGGSRRHVGDGVVDVGVFQAAASQPEYVHDVYRQYGDKSHATCGMSICATSQVKVIKKDASRIDMPESSASQSWEIPGEQLRPARCRQRLV
ncbi:MAG: hypothetical protein LBS77_02615 [Desulfovibrio sp.]|jgi:hypothetical protein|nr:hypothetical protein [Desulfovibrio sp.]